MSTTISGYATPLSSSSSSTSLSKPPPKPKPVNVFSNDGSFLERFQRLKQEEQDRRKTEEALAKSVPVHTTLSRLVSLITSYRNPFSKKHFADRFKNRGKRPPPPDSSCTVTSTDLDPNPAKKPKLVDNDDDAPQEYQKRTGDHVGRSPKDTGTYRK